MAGGTQTPVTVIGLGAMGTALARAFLDNGHPTTVWNRSAGRADELAAGGAVVAATAAEAVAASLIVVVCVLDYDAVQEVLDSVAGTMAGRALVNLTTGTPRQARATAAWASKHGARYVDGGIMAVPSMIGRPEAFILYSGSSEAFSAHERCLGELGAATYLGEDAGQACLYDLALLSAMYGMFGGFFHALAMIGSEQVPASQFTPLAVSWLQAMTALLPEMARAVDSGDHSTTEASVEMQAAGFATLMDASRDQGVNPELMAPMRTLLERGVATGRGSGDISALVELLRTDLRPE